MTDVHKMMAMKEAALRPVARADGELAGILAEAMSGTEIKSEPKAAPSPKPPVELRPAEDINSSPQHVSVKQSRRHSRPRKQQATGEHRLYTVQLRDDQIQQIKIDAVTSNRKHYEILQDIVDKHYRKS